MPAALAPAMYEDLAMVARAAEAAGQGSRTAVYNAAAERMGISTGTLLERLKQVRAPAPRKQRSDAGGTSLRREEAVLIAAAVEETRRLTGTGELALAEAVDALRSAGKIQAGRVDLETGEFHALSTSAIRRALRQYHCHPSQLAAPTPAQSLRSDHPNHCWQMDASISRQFYLDPSGTKVMPRSEYYRGKPANFERINDKRIIRYNVVDHTTNHPRLFFALRAESALNSTAALINAMTPKDGIAMHGVPICLEVDKGTDTATLRNFCDSMGIALRAHATGNPRAIGSAEGGHDLIETLFEANLKLRAPVVSIEEINGLADEWCRAYCATRIHSRTQMSRRDAWLRITPEQLRLAPAPEVLRELAMSNPQICTVRDFHIRFRGAKWDVRELPGAFERQKLRVAINAYDSDTVRVLITGADGRPTHFLAPRVQLDDWGFSLNGARIGQGFQAMPDTPVDAVRKEISRVAMGVRTDAEAAAARKAKRVAFGGDLAPEQRWRTANVPDALPRAGTPHEVHTPDRVEPQRPLPTIRPEYTPTPLSHLEMARGMKRLLEARGGTWSTDLYVRMTALWPDGLPEERLDESLPALLRGGLRVAGAA